MQSSQHLVLALHRATALVDRVADRHLQAHHGITVSMLAALVSIDAVGPASQSEVARTMDVSRAAVTQRLTALTARGLVQVGADPADSRANVVSLAPAGRRLLAAAWEGLARSGDGLEQGVDVGGLQTALELVIANAERYLDGTAGVR